MANGDLYEVQDRGKVDEVALIVLLVGLDLGHHEGEIVTNDVEGLEDDRVAEGDQSSHIAVGVEPRKRHFKNKNEKKRGCSRNKIFWKQKNK